MFKFMQAGAGIFKPYLYVSGSKHLGNVMSLTCFGNILQTRQHFAITKPGGINIPAPSVYIFRLKVPSTKNRDIGRLKLPSSDKTLQLKPYLQFFVIGLIRAITPIIV